MPVTASIRRLLEHSLDYETKGAKPPLGLNPPELLQLTWTRQFSTAAEFVREYEGPLRKEDLGIDFEHRTAAHYSAGHSDGEALLELLVTTVGCDCLLDADEDGVTPMHLSARYHSSEQFDRNRKHLSSQNRLLLTEDKDMFTIVHWAASNAAHGGKIIQLISQVEPHCFRWLSNSGATALEVATEVLSPESFKWCILDMRVDENSNTFLHYAARMEEASVLLTALEIFQTAGKSPAACLRSKNNDMKNVFDIAAEHYDPETLRKLLGKSGTQLSDWKNEDIKNLLHSLATNKSAKIEAFQIFTKYIESTWIGWRNELDETVLHVAAKHCANEETLQKLFEKADRGVILSKDQNGNTVLHCMAENTMAQDILAENQFCKPKSLLMENKTKKTVLHIAAEYCSTDTLDRLISIANQEGGFDWFRKDISGNTVMHCLVKNKTGTYELSDLYPNSLDCKNNDGQTVLHFVAETCCSTEILEKLAGQRNLKESDQQGNTFWHYLARNKLAESVLINKNISYGPFLAPSFLSWSNKDKKTVLHEAAAHFSAQAIKQLLDQVGPDSIELRDSKGDTVMHYLARNQEALLEVLTSHKYAGPKCLSWKNNNGETVFDLAISCSNSEERLMHNSEGFLFRYRWDPMNTKKKLKCLSKLFASVLAQETESVKKVQRQESRDQKKIREFNEESSFMEEGSEQVKTKQENERNERLNAEGKSWAICSAFQEFGSNCLSWENSDGITILQVAVRVCQPEVAKSFLIKIFRCCEDCFSHGDSWGNTWAHIAATNCFDMENDVLSVVNDHPECLSWQNNEKQTVLHLAIKNIRVFRKLMRILQVRGKKETSAKKKAFNTVVTAADAEENTLLHYLFQPNTCVQESEAASYLQAIKALKKANVDPYAVDNVGHNFLLAANDKVPMRAVLENCSESGSHADKELFLRLLSNSNGLHAIHIFAAKHNLKDLIGPLEKLVKIPSRDLLHLVVSGGMHKGATCLHFACKAGHRENITYLIIKGLQLSAETDSGWSCVGFALENDSLEQIERNLNTLKIDLQDTELWRLIDPTKRALTLPDRSTARQVCKDTVEKSKLVPYGSNLALLIESFELDSPNILRSAFCLNKINDKEERLLLKHLENTTDYRGLFSDENLTDGHSELSIIDAAVFEFNRHKIKEEILPDIILTRQFELIPACISLLIRLKSMVYESKGKVRHERLLGLYNKVTGIAVNALDGLYNNADKKEKRLLMQYMRGKLPGGDEPSENQGPKFPCRPAAKEGKVKYCTVMEMVEEAASNDLFATDCVFHLVQKHWRSQLRKEVGVRSCRGKTFTANWRFGFHFAAFIVFMIFFAWYVTDFEKTFQYWPLDFVLLAYAASLTMQEFTEFLRRSKVVNVYTSCGIRHCPVYVKDTFNFFDCLALLFMWAGLVLKMIIWSCLPGNPNAPRLCLPSSGIFSKANVEQGFTNEPLISSKVQYVCQMILSTSFLLWGFRSVSFFNRFQRIGPVISMLKSLIIQDLFPFLLIILVIFYSFGFFFFNLLFPVVAALPSTTNTTEYRLSVALQIFTLPLNLMFTNFDRTKFEPASPEDPQAVGLFAHQDGHGWFYNLMLFIFLILSNIVMLNLLIARFNLTVIKMHSRALGIWRTTYYEMLQEYKNISFLPPPLSFLEYPFRICFWCFKRKVQKKNKVASERTCFYWLQASDYPHEYKEFLKFQATQLRSIRPSLSLEVTRNKSDTDILMAHTENVSAATLRELQEGLQRLEAKVEAIEESRSVRRKKRAERQKQRKTELSEILCKLEQLVPSKSTNRE